MAAVAMPVPDEPFALAPQTVTVVIATAADERWHDVVRSIELLERQTRPPDQLVLVVDHNDDLLQRAADAMAQRESKLRIDVVANLGRLGRAGARNTGVAWSDGDVVAFLDDGAWAADDYWVATMLEDYLDPSVAGVGGGATPRWTGSDAPRWFPPEFGWVIGCSSVGPTADAWDVPVLAGGNLSFRREVFDELGGFGPGGTGEAAADETDYCVRLRRRFPDARLVFDPDLDVVRRVEPTGVDFGSFRTRCWHQGMSAAVVARDGAAAFPATFTPTALSLGVLRGVGDGLRGRLDGFQRVGAIGVGIGCTVAGYARGRISGARR